MILGIFLGFFLYLLVMYLFFLYLIFSAEINNTSDRYNDPVYKYTLTNEEVERMNYYNSFVLPDYLANTYKPIQFNILYNFERLTA